MKKHISNAGYGHASLLNFCNTTINNLQKDEIWVLIKVTFSPEAEILSSEIRLKNEWLKFSKNVWITFQTKEQSCNTAALNVYINIKDVNRKID